jgi:4-hydroxybutyrate CoA-transferase
MNAQLEYRKRLMSGLEASRLIKDGQTVFQTSEPVSILKALRERYLEYNNLTVVSMGMTNCAAHHFEDPELNGHIRAVHSYMTKVEHQAQKRGRIFEYRAAHMSEMEDLIRSIRPDYVLIASHGMDENGNFQLGHNPIGAVAAVEAGAKAIVEVNPNIPLLNTDYNIVNIRDVAAICEGNTPITFYPTPVPDEKAKKIAGYIGERVQDGATIQVGFGSVPDAVAMALMAYGKKDLGIHTEVLTPSMVRMIMNGTVNNSKKTVEKGKTVFGFLNPSEESLKFMHGNDTFVSKQIGWINNRNVIMQNYRMTSINACLGVDLKGQISSETLGFRHYSGTGGQLDFVYGARRAPEGQSFLTMNSTVEKPDGTRISKICLNFEPGTVVSVSRNDVDKVVTEYGVAELLYKTDSEKAKALISIAHPDFRDELTFQAKKHGIIV